MGNAAEEEKKYYLFMDKGWRIFAPFYDPLTKKPLSGLRRKVVEFTDAPRSSRILDVCTGTGEQALAFARMGHGVIGVDMSEAMLSIARTKNKLPNLRFELADATSLPFGNHGFDVACVSFGLHEMPSSVREKTLKEMARVTRPAGLILIADYGLPSNAVGRFLFYHFVRLYEGKHYGEFLRSNLQVYLRTIGIEVVDELRALLGGARVLKGVRAG